MLMLKDLVVLYNNILLEIDIFGATPEFKDSFAGRIKALNKFIVAKAGITIQEARKEKDIPEVELSSAAEKKFIELKKWLASQDINLKKASRL